MPGLLEDRQLRPRDSLDQVLGEGRRCQHVAPTPDDLGRRCDLRQPIAEII
jgi:hypothetical protein